MGPVTYVCEEGEGEVTATFYKTDPPVVIAQYRGSESLMYLQPSGSGARYVGRNESLWEHHGAARITWGYGSPEMTCSAEQ